MTLVWKASEPAGKQNRMWQLGLWGILGLYAPGRFGLLFCDGIGGLIRGLTDLS